jgi:hypothetical protein
MSSEQAALDHFGRFITKHLRDAMIEHFDSLAASYWKAPGLQALQGALALVPHEHIEIVRRAVIAAADSTVHDFLFKLQEQADFENRIQVTVDGIDVVAVSDGIHGEAYSDEGWYARFSSFGKPSEEA